jgi:long-chain fatty acid transport protein
MKSITYAGVSTILLCIVSGLQAQAGGFALKERSAKAQGLSFAGVSAGSGGLSSAGFNPATFGLVEHAEISAGLSLVSPISDGKVSAGGVSTGEEVDADTLGILANTYAGYRLSPSLVAGISVNTPFGLKTEYPTFWTGQGDARRSELITLQVSPTVAFQPMPELTLAIAGHILYADAELTSSLVDLKADSFDYSFAAGVLWQLTHRTTVGIAYDHGYDLPLKGDARGPATGGVKVPLTAKASLPATVSLGIIHEVTGGVRVLGEFQWQNWSVFDSLELEIGPGFQSDPQNYNDAFFVAVGGEYDASDALTLRAGVAWDETPTISGILPGTPAALGITNRTARVPDEDRIWISAGASYDVTESITIDAGYSYLFTLEDAVVGLRTAPGTRVVYDGGAHIFSIGGSFRF